MSTSARRFTALENSQKRYRLQVRTKLLLYDADNNDNAIYLLGYEKIANAAKANYLAHNI